MGGQEYVAPAAWPLGPGGRAGLALGFHGAPAPGCLPGRPAGRKRLKEGTEAGAASARPPACLPACRRVERFASRAIKRPRSVQRVGWKPARVTMAMRNYYLLPGPGEKACTFGSQTRGVDLCNSPCL